MGDTLKLFNDLFGVIKDIPSFPRRGMRGGSAMGIPFWGNRSSTNYTLSCKDKFLSNHPSLSFKRRGFYQIRLLLSNLTIIG
jgi:hypothetical protein